MKRPTYSLNRYAVELKEGLKYTYELSTNNLATPVDREIFLGEIEIKNKDNTNEKYDCLFIYSSSSGSKIIKPYSFDSDTLEFLNKEISIAEASKTELEEYNDDNISNLNIISAIKSESGG